METTKMIIDLILRFIGLIVVLGVIFNTVWKLIAPKEKDPTKGLIYGVRSKKPFIVRLRKRFKI